MRYGNLFGDDESGQTVQELPISQLRPYKDHPFRLYDGERLDAMVRSVRELGVITPVIVRPSGSDAKSYEILSGHNRVNAAKAAGIKEVPGVIMQGLTDDEAALIVTETNLVQRSFSDLTYSQRALALKHHLDAIKAQGKRSDILKEIESLSNTSDTNGNATSCQIGTKLGRSDEHVGERYDLSPRNVARYIRLTHLTAPLLDRVDSGEIGFIPAVTLSYLSPAEQDDLEMILSDDAFSFKVDIKKAEALRELSQSGKLTPAKMVHVLNGEAGKPKEVTAKITPKVWKRYFPESTPQSEIESVIEKALELYFGTRDKNYAGHL
jgi:ParB family chromosome partitioning protein